MDWKEWLNLYGPAWVQALGSVGALLLAIYVPARMRRAEEFDRLQSTIRAAEELCEMSANYVRSLEQGIGLSPHPPTSFPVLISAIRGHIAAGNLPAEFLGYLNEVAISAQLIADHWSGAGAGNARRDNPGLIGGAKLRSERIHHMIEFPREYVRQWRKKHRMVLAFY